MTILPEQIRRLADFSEGKPGAVEIWQQGSVLHLFDGSNKISVDANGRDIHPSQEQLC